MKITKNCLEEDPQTPFKLQLFLDSIMLYIHIDNQMNFKHAAAPFTYSLYVHSSCLYCIMHVHILVVRKNAKKKSHGNSCPVSLLN